MAPRSIGAVAPLSTMSPLSITSPSARPAGPPGSSPPVAIAGRRARWRWRVPNYNPTARERLQRRGVHDLVGRLPDAGEVLDGRRLVGVGVDGLPGDHHLVHPAPIERGADPPLPLLDESMHLPLPRR